MTVGLLIEDSKAASENKGRWVVRYLAANALGWSILHREREVICSFDETKPSYERFLADLVSAADAFELGRFAAVRNAINVCMISLLGCMFSLLSCMISLFC
jgi:hypothetical protein